MQIKTVKISEDKLLWFGGHFFKVEKAAKENSQLEFHPRCPSCDNTRKITYKGFDGNEYTCTCPICSGEIGRVYRNYIKLNNWEVHEYIVHDIKLCGPCQVSISKDNYFADYVTMEAFHKFGRCADNYITTKVPSNKAFIDPDLSKIDLTLSKTYVYDYIFTNKKNALELCRMFKEFDKKRLEDFNKTFKTDYNYPF